MKRLTSSLTVLLLILGGIALATAADLPQAPKTVDLSGFQKLTDQEAQEIRGTGLVWISQSVGFQIEPPRLRAVAMNNLGNPGVGDFDRDRDCWDGIRP